MEVNTGDKDIDLALVAQAHADAARTAADEARAKVKNRVHPTKGVLSFSGVESWEHSGGGRLVWYQRRDIGNPRTVSMDLNDWVELPLAEG